MATTTTTSKAGKATKDSKGQELYLLVQEVREHGYFHLYARVCTQKYEGNSWVPYGCEDDYSDGLLWSGLRASCQGDDRSRAQAAAGTGDGVYGFDVEYKDVWSLGLRKARRMVKTLDKIDRGLDRLTETRGYVKSYGEYLGRLAEVLGCAGIGFKRAERAYNGSEYAWDAIGEGVNRTNRLIWQWQEDGKPAAASERRQLHAASESDVDAEGGAA